MVSPVGEEESLSARQVVPADLEMVAGPGGGRWRRQDQPLPHRLAGWPAAGREVAVSNLPVILAEAPTVRTDQVDEEVKVLRHRLLGAPVQVEPRLVVLRDGAVAFEADAL